MNSQLPAESLAQLFSDARTFNAFDGRPVSEQTLQALYEAFKWAPTSMNCQPARLVFVTSADAKAQLRDCLSPGNIDKTMAAPTTAIVAIDTQFYEALPTQFPSFAGARDMFAQDPALAEVTAFRNSSMQAGYLILAARALGLDAGPMSGFDATKLNARFFPDGRYRANLLINLGYGDPSGNHPRGPRLPYSDAVTVL